MRIIKDGTIYKIQIEKTNWCSHQKYWKTLSYERIADGNGGSGPEEYVFGSVEAAEKFIQDNYNQLPIEVVHITNG